MLHGVWGISVFESSHVVIWQVPDFQPAVRDRAMNRTFLIISPHFRQFNKQDWFYWFHVILTPVLPSFSPKMLENATANINCTNYHVVWVAFQEQARLTWKKCKMLMVDSIRMFIPPPVQCEWDGQSFLCNAVAKTKRNHESSAGLPDQICQCHQRAR